VAREGQIEREFGVPFPGRILSEERWTRTGLKNLPREGPVDWNAVFGRSAPLIMDLGCGNGRYIIGSALARPEFNHLGVDVLPVVIRYATRRANQRGLKNIRLAVRGAFEFLKDLVEPRSTREIHLYHPQPYADPEDSGRRLVQPDFLALIHRSLEPGGLLVIQTDNSAYWKYLKRTIPYFFEFREHPGAWSDAPLGRTRREIIARSQGLKIYRGTGTPLPELDPARRDQLAAELPPALFQTKPKGIAFRSPRSEGTES
jgi:tRNA (guanine-N7-)-methyltransferase